MGLPPQGLLCEKRGGLFPQSIPWSTAVPPALVWPVLELEFALMSKVAPSSGQGTPSWYIYPTP